MEAQSDDIRDLRSWLFELLAELERVDKVKATRTILSSRHIIIDIKFNEA
jgi:hypothetical protein